MSFFVIQYEFTLPDNTKETFNLEIDSQSLELTETFSDDSAFWTDLEFNQCPNCPLTRETHPKCPVARRLAKIVNRFDRISSYDRVKIKVVSEERSISQDTEAQSGISSLMGLVIATSGCPHTAFFKAMARFHLPLATHEETTYRVASAYLLSQYLHKSCGGQATLELDGLKDIYANLQTINLAVAERFREAAKTDSSTNAIIMLDTLAQLVPYSIDEALEELRYLFDAFFEEQKTVPLHHPESN